MVLLIPFSTFQLLNIKQVLRRVLMHLKQVMHLVSITPWVLIMTSNVMWQVFSAPVRLNLADLDTLSCHLSLILSLILLCTVQALADRVSSDLALGLLLWGEPLWLIGSSMLVMFGLVSLKGELVVLLFGYWDVRHGWLALMAEIELLSKVTWLS